MEHLEAEYDKRVSELFEKHQSVQNAGFTGAAYKPGLEGMLSLDKTLGCPHKSFRTIHVAGTNGKGSVCSMLASSLSATGYRVGLYTSPHLLDFRERMRIVGEGTIGKDEVLDFLDNFDGSLEGRSFFEITTGMAFWWFASGNVDVAVIETGLGGRLDSTNIIVPEISVVTSIGLDHCAILGGTRSEIAAEKAGIFKPGVPAVVGERDAETSGVFEKKAAEVHCPLFFADDFPETDTSVVLDLEGPCQKENLRTVLTVLDLLGEEPEMDAISHTAERTSFRGRWERLSSNPEVICDIGHNPPALKYNFAKLESYRRPLVIVYGIMSDKDLDGIAPLLPGSAQYVLVAPDTSRAMKAAELRRRLSAIRPDLRTMSSDSVAEGVEKALEIAADIPGALVYIGGSTFVVSEAVTYMDKLKYETNR